MITLHILNAPNIQCSYKEYKIHLILLQCGFVQYNQCFCVNDPNFIRRYKKKRTFGIDISIRFLLSCKWVHQRISNICIRITNLSAISFLFLITWKKQNEHFVQVGYTDDVNGDKWHISIKFNMEFCQRYVWYDSTTFWCIICRQFWNSLE